MKRHNLRVRVIYEALPLRTVEDGIFVLGKALLFSC